ncbi:hypothetical protein FNV43_RR05922 [Rhamnella rubrinervis]|uniref:Uncharacterized protein n=1 Tax=Rhamnella rubrinervis TaxID=2594499 RepID=A0A8K0MLA0_9ROSA|nr:hypothetical protein FNV43_RR05922 [Rhamnella rubrinervis]
MFPKIRDSHILRRKSVRGCSIKDAVSYLESGGGGSSILEPMHYRGCHGFANYSTVAPRSQAVFVVDLVPIKAAKLCKLLFEAGVLQIEPPDVWGWVSSSWFLFRSSSVVCDNEFVREVAEGELRLRGCRGFERICVVDADLNLQICPKGNLLSICVNDAAYQERVALCQFSLIARIILSKGEKLSKFEDIYTKLQSIWKLDKWQLISLGRGYFHVLLFSAEDRQNVWSHGSLNLKLGNYNNYARVLIDVDLAGFIPEKLLLEMTDDCIEVELYFESFLDFCTSCHNVGHSVGKCKLVIGKVPSKDGYHVNKKENKAPALNQVYKLKQVPPQPVKSTTPSVPTTNAFEVLNTEVTPAHIKNMVHQHDAAPSNMTNKMGIKVQSFAPDLGVATTRTDINTETGNEPEDNEYVDDFGEDEWRPLQVQQNLDLVASQSNISETTYQNLWNVVKRKPGRPRKVRLEIRSQINAQTFMEYGGIFHGLKTRICGSDLETVFTSLDLPLMHRYLGFSGSLRIEMDASVRWFLWHFGNVFIPLALLWLLFGPTRKQMLLKEYDATSVSDLPVLKFRSCGSPSRAPRLFRGLVTADGLVEECLEIWWDHLYGVRLHLRRQQLSHAEEEGRNTVLGSSIEDAVSSWSPMVVGSSDLVSLCITGECQWVCKL